MFFCPKYNNPFDISRTYTQSQTGGNVAEIDYDIHQDENNNVNINENEFLQSPQNTYTQHGGDLYGDIIFKILKNKPISADDVKNVDVEKLIKSSDYKKLKSRYKQTVYNKIQDLLPKEKKKIILDGTKASSENIAFFTCTNCSYGERIKEGTLIFSRTSDSISQSYDTNDYSDLYHSTILPKTRKYVCPNTKCESHTNPELREAKFFRMNNSYTVKHICLTCKAQF